VYEIDEHDLVIEISDVPQPDIGAPLPAVVAAEHALDLIYIASEPDPDWDGSYVNVVGPNSEEQPVVVVSFERPYAHFFGPPNDEAFEGHPLAARGLNTYSAAEVRNSSWIRSLKNMNSVHPHHQPSQFANFRHFIFSFHDTTFECVAGGYKFSCARESVATVAATRPVRWS